MKKLGKKETTIKISKESRKMLRLMKSEKDFNTYDQLINYIYNNFF